MHYWQPKKGGIPSPSPLTAAALMQPYIRCTASKSVIIRVQPRWGTKRAIFGAGRQLQESAFKKELCKFGAQVVKWKLPEFADYVHEYDAYVKLTPKEIVPATETVIFGHIPPCLLLRFPTYVFTVLLSLGRVTAAEAPKKEGRVTNVLDARERIWNCSNSPMVRSPQNTMGERTQTFSLS